MDINVIKVYLNRPNWSERLQNVWMKQISHLVVKFIL